MKRINLQKLFSRDLFSCKSYQTLGWVWSSWCVRMWERVHAFKFRQQTYECSTEHIQYEYVGQNLLSASLPSVTYKCQSCKAKGGRFGRVFFCACLWVCVQAFLIRVTFPSPSLSVLAAMMWMRHQTDNGERQTDRQTGASGACQSDRRMDRLTDWHGIRCTEVCDWLWFKLWLIPWMSPTEYITAKTEFYLLVFPSSLTHREFTLGCFELYEDLSLYSSIFSVLPTLNMQVIHYIWMAVSANRDPNTEAEQCTAVHRVSIF